MARRGLWRVEGKGVTPLGAEQGLPGDRYRALASDPAGGLWVATNQGLARLEGTRVAATYAVRDGLTSDDVLSVLVDGDGTLWVGTGRGVTRRAKGGAFERVSAAGTRVVAALLQDHDGSIWAGTRDGLLRVAGGKADPMGRAAGLPDEHVAALAEDAEGDLWVGTEAGGIARLRDGRARVYGKAQGLTHEVIWSVLEGRDGSVWIGTDGGGLNRLRGDRAGLATREKGFDEENVYALYEDRAGRVWFSTEWHGLCRLAAGRVDCLTGSFAEDLVRCLLEDKDGRMWAGTSEALVRIDGRAVHPVATEDGKKITVTSLAEGPSGRGRERRVPEGDDRGHASRRSRHVSPRRRRWHALAGHHGRGPPAPAGRPPCLDHVTPGPAQRQRGLGARRRCGPGLAFDRPRHPRHRAR
jgi:ligand-binding sensor domain-containing protein